MIHLLAMLLRNPDPAVIALVLAEALLGAAGATQALLWGRSRPLRPMLTATLFAVAMTLVSWLAFRTALAGTYPRLSLAVPTEWAVPAIAISLVTAMTAAMIDRRGRRSARNALVAGSLLACGFSCMLFTGMAGLVRPFALAYDLTAVVVVMVLGAALCGFALWEAGNPERKYRWAIGTSLTAMAIIVMAFGSLAAILPFDAWMTAVSQPDDVASSPVAIIVGVESVVVLVMGLSGSLVDNRVAARDRLETDRLRQLADSTLEGILIHRDGEILDGNGSIVALLGVSLAELRSSRIDRFLAPDSDASVWTDQRGTAPVETEILAMDGCRLPVEILSRGIGYGGSSAIVTAVRDVRERHASEQRIHFLAHHDMLTQLPNRVMLNETLGQSLQFMARTEGSLAVLCIDLDGFKAVNDALGHAAGDHVLREVAARLLKAVRATDCVARVGGDEFVVVQTSGAQPEQAEFLARRIIDSLVPTFHVEERDVNIGTSIGVALYPQDGITPTTLLKNADIALYRAKESRLGGFSMFEIGMDQALRKRREMQSDMVAALKRQEFTLDFQPLFDRSRQPVAFEALVRWHHPTQGIVPPSDFIPLAEECGLIVPLGQWIMRTACTAAMEWVRNCRVAVNLSPAQFRRSDLRAMIASILAETGLPADRLELEITEGVLMDSTDGAARTLIELRQLGTRLVLDDFGTGYSSLSYLQRLPFDKLKIDRAFVQRLGVDAGSDAIVSAILAMSRSLNLDVTAEGVETVEQFDLLCAQGCHEIQGFLLGRPMPKEAINPFLMGCLPPSVIDLSLHVRRA